MYDLEFTNITLKNLHTFVQKIEKLSTQKEDFWKKIAQKQTLALFREVASRVPAYKDFLKRHKINPSKIKTFEDFQNVPPINKENYLHYYSLNWLVWDKDLSRPVTIHSTSGSTGEPTYFYRDLNNDLLRIVTVNQFLNLRKDWLKGRTLFIITFGMGVWSAGMGIYTGTYLLSKLKNLKFSIISPGVNKIEILKILKRLAPSYDNIIIAGYPPFVKDIIDEASDEGINLKKFNLRFIFTGESFPEEFRDYLKKKTNINIYLDTANTYGTSEIGATGLETPLSILITRLSLKSKNLFKDLFGVSILKPTLVQYNSLFVNFEEVNGELFLTGYNYIPLIRYQIGDSGGILYLSQIKDIFQKHNIDLNEQLSNLNIPKFSIKEMPFVFIKGRTQSAITYYGILIYPEFIKTALYDPKIDKYLTGKFTMLTQYDKNNNQYIEINLEVKKGNKINNSIKKYIAEKIFHTLRKKSSEFRELSNDLKERAIPVLKFHSYESGPYFMPGSNKQKWVITR